ncbi:uncharacterized protein MCYG_06708 [Microsporum canis CBS 113480]|uniref:Uncharacterized protein n=1 Tax=Arthroderma otae (strain ATCC MYA-4605 / CBS 113480) TaxID=554155 RepID=C5FVF5_ARTOC|nr:uncharacterized protein MCYG_06708 [Microsporum canis CBS 113480]EEQ33889.1 predicted protein [Microsporum canis CBS 113480]
MAGWGWSRHITTGSQAEGSINSRANKAPNGGSGSHPPSSTHPLVPLLSQQSFYPKTDGLSLNVNHGLSPSGRTAPATFNLLFLVCFESPSEWTGAVALQVSSKTGHENTPCFKATVEISLFSQQALFSRLFNSKNMSD